MTDKQVRTFSQIYVWALVLTATGVAMAAIGKRLAVTVWGFTDDWSEFPLQLVAPEIAYFFGGWAAIYVLLMLVRSRQLLKLQGAERLQSYETLQGVQTFVGGFTMVFAAIMLPVSFILPLFSGLAGFSFSFLTFSGVAIHFASRALYKSVKRGEPAPKELAEDQENAELNAPQAPIPVTVTDASKVKRGLSTWSGGPSMLCGIFFLVAALLVVPTAGASQSDLGAGLMRFAAVVVGAMQIGPTIYALIKGYRDFWLCLGLGLLTIVVFVAVGVR